MSRGDAWSVAVTLLATGGVYFIGGKYAAYACLIVGAIIALILHFTRLPKEEKEGKEGSGRIEIKDSFRQEANPQIHLHVGTEAKPPVAAPPRTEPRPLPAPNLQFRGRYVSKIWVGPEIGGHSVDALLAEIGNELGELGEQVGFADSIRGHLTYKNQDEKTLQIICPSRWENEGDSVYIHVGESRKMILAYNQGYWVSAQYDGIDLRKCSEIELRLIDIKGKQMLDKPIIFDCGFTGGYENPKYTKR